LGFERTEFYCSLRGSRSFERGARTRVGDLSSSGEDLNWWTGVSSTRPPCADGSFSIVPTNRTLRASRDIQLLLRMIHRFDRLALALPKPKGPDAHAAAGQEVLGATSASRPY